MQLEGLPSSNPSAERMTALRSRMPCSGRCGIAGEAQAPGAGQETVVIIAEGDMVGDDAVTNGVLDYARYLEWSGEALYILQDRDSAQAFPPQSLISSR